MVSVPAKTLSFLAARAASVLLVLAVPAWAEQSVQEVIVEGEAKQELDELGASTVSLSGEELVTRMGATLGDTLANESGVHNASYGPGVGLPVLRGLSGVRVRLSEDGIGAWDASAISPDHATAIEAAIAERIDVVKGPATVLHGNNAVGGTVEVSNGRIATALPDQRVSTLLEARREIVNDHDRQSYVGKIRAHSHNLVLQLDGFWRDANDMSIPARAIDEEAIGELFGIFNSDNTFGTVLNTDSEARSGSVGLSYVGEQFYLGASTTHVDNEYGIPPGAHTEPADSPGHSHVHPVGESIVLQARVRIDLEQERNQLKLGGELDGDLLDAYRVTLGQVTYRHREFEINPETGVAANATLFFNDVVEFKAELDHHWLRALNSEHVGTFGVQFIDREFSAKGEGPGGGENFVPATDQQVAGIFLFERLPYDWGSLEFGARYEYQEIVQQEATAPLLPDNLRFSYAPLRYQTYTLSGSLRYELNEQHALIANLNSAQRAPDIQELLSLGPHLATRSYDIGLLVGAQGRDLPEPEQHTGAELRWEWRGDWGDMTSAVFYTDVSDFVFQQNNGFVYDFGDELFRTSCVRLEECIGVYDYVQDDVTLAGYEWQWFSPTVPAFEGDVGLELFADYVRGKLKDGGDLPRMPPRRRGLGLQWERDQVTAEIRYSYVSEQDHEGANDVETDAYKLLNFRLTYTHHFEGDPHRDLLLFLQGKNLRDQEIRKSTSFLRSFTPEPGREFSVGLRLQF